MVNQGMTTIFPDVPAGATPPLPVQKPQYSSMSDSPLFPVPRQSSGAITGVPLVMSPEGAGT